VATPPAETALDRIGPSGLAGFGGPCREAGSLTPGGSDRQGQLVEGSQDPQIQRFLGPEFVVAAAEILDEGVASAEMTSRGKRNPVKLDLGGGTRRWRRRISSACLKLPSTNATAPTSTGHQRCWPASSAPAACCDGGRVCVVADFSGPRPSWNKLARPSNPAHGVLSRRWQSAATGWRGQRCLRRLLRRRPATSQS
jgi:hypothetical protein